MKVFALAFIAILTMPSLPVLADNAKSKWETSAKDAWIDGQAETVLLFRGNLNTFDI